MFDRVTIRAGDRGASERFYDLVLATLGIGRTDAAADIAEWRDFSVAQAAPTGPITRHLHIGFVAPSRAHADAFWRAGIAAGHHDDGQPGPRPQYGDDYYGAFLLDPDGNSAEAVHHDTLRQGGAVDHLWMRVADVSASKRFYEAIAADIGARVAFDSAERVRFAGASGSFSVVRGAPVTAHAHLTFRAASAATAVDPDGNTVELVNGERR